MESPGNHDTGLPGPSLAVAWKTLVASLCVVADMGIDCGLGTVELETAVDVEVDKVFQVLDGVDRPPGAS